MNDEIVKRLSQLTKLNKGTLTPKAVVEDARDPDSPLHEHFDWDDTSAAERYREEQARGLIRQVKVVIEVDEVVMRVPAYVHDPDLEPGEAGYVTTAKLRTKEEKARVVMALEIKRVRSALARAQEVSAALGLEGEVRELEDRVEAMLRKIAA